MAPARYILISCLASARSLAAAQPTCVEGPELGGDDSALLQLSSGSEPPPCLGKVCGEVCFNRQNKMGKCNRARQCETSGKTICTGGTKGFDNDLETQAMYCFLPQNFSCYSKGWPSCCLGRGFCTKKQKKPACDLNGGGTDQDEPSAFDLVGIGSCKAPKKFIENKSQCQAAANNLGYGEPVNDAVLPTSPYGCYFKDINPIGRKLWFNPNGDRNSQDRERVSICQVSQPKSECENKACGVACKKGVCSAAGICSELSRAPELGCEDNEDYRLVSIQDYTIDDSADTDHNWFDYADVFVEVLCGSTRYTSKVLKDQNQGHVGMHFFVSSRDSCILNLHDDDGGSHETILTGTIPVDQASSDGNLHQKVRTCFFGGFCSTSIAAEVKYSIASGSKARERLSSGAPLTPGVQSVFE